MFLFSSSSLLQAYKRLQYLKQYALFERNKERRLQIKHAPSRVDPNLNCSKEKKETLIEENRAVQKALAKELDQQQRLVQSLRKKAGSTIGRLLKNKSRQKKLIRKSTA